MLSVVTKRSARGSEIDICMNCLQGERRRQFDDGGSEYSQIVRPLHPGHCEVCRGAGEQAPAGRAAPWANSMPDPDLARVVKAWPNLPAAVRASVVDLIAAAVANEGFNERRMPS